MSSADQPLLIANSNYHVGQQVATYVAEEQGLFQEEGFTNYDYDDRGLIAGPLERDGLALAMEEHGVDVATAVHVGTALFQHLQGVDIKIVGGWRYAPDYKCYGAKRITAMAQLRGCRIGIRETGGLGQIFIANALRRAGLNPDTDVKWMYDPIFSYGNDPAHLEMLRSGKVDAMMSFPPYSQQLEREGFTILADPKVEFPGGRPDKVTVATTRTIEQRGEELRAYFRGIIRAFWFMRDVANFEYLRSLEARLRKSSHNDDERRLSIVTSLEKVEGWALPIDGGVSREALERVIREMVEIGELDCSISVEEVLHDGAVTDAYREVSGRPEMQPALQKALAVVAKYGF
jgi:ABC-type nitrate/sulfonate/bicarbonate transport system substrate-binding protein